MNGITDERLAELRYAVQTRVAIHGFANDTDIDASLAELQALREKHRRDNEAMSVIHRAADIVRASRPAATPLREAAERLHDEVVETLREWGDDRPSEPAMTRHARKLRDAQVALRAAMAAPALSREELRKGIEKICDRVHLETRLDMHTNPTNGEAIQQPLRAILDAVCGHG